MPTDPNEILLVLFAGVLVAELTILVRRHLRLGPWLFMAVTVATSWGQLGEAVVAGFQVYPLDVISVVLIGSIALQPRAVSRLPLVLVALSVVTAFAIFAVFPYSVWQLRSTDRAKTIYLMAALGFMSMGLVPYRELERIWLTASAVLVVGAVLFFAAKWVRDIRKRWNPRPELIAGPHRCPIGNHAPGRSARSLIDCVGSDLAADRVRFSAANCLGSDRGHATRSRVQPCPVLGQANGA